MVNNSNSQITETRSFYERLQAVEKELQQLIATPEYRQMLADGYVNRCDIPLVGAVMAVQQCQNEFYANEIMEGN